MIVAVDGPPAVADLAQDARGRLEDHHRRIDVADLRDAGIDQAAAGGEQLNRFLAEQPTHHIEVVDHHVAEQTAAGLQVFERRKSRIPAGDADGFNPPDVAPVDSRAQGGKAGIEAPVKADGEGDAGFADHVEACFDPPDVQIERFLAEDGLACPRRGLDQVGVGIGRAGDDDRLDLRVGKRLLGRGDPRADPVRQRGCRNLVDVDYGGQRRILVGVKVGRVDRADPPGAKLTEPQHNLPPPLLDPRAHIIVHGLVGIIPSVINNDAVDVLSARTPRKFIRHGSSAFVVAGQYRSI